jgi:SSS family solute:Na+ symporter
MNPNEVFADFIVKHMPSGVSGLIIAGLFAAAMSTLAGSMSSLASSAMVDIYKPYFGKDNDERKELFVSRVITRFGRFFWLGLLCFLCARKGQLLNLL